MPEWETAAKHLLEPLTSTGSNIRYVNLGRALAEEVVLRRGKGESGGIGKRKRSRGWWVGSARKNTKGESGEFLKQHVTPIIFHFCPSGYRLTLARPVLFSAGKHEFYF